jgi:predicted  nucleic acid-binding Zn-ribbon protein
MKTFPFESFIDVVRFDQDMKKLNATIGKEQKVLHQLQEQKKQYEQEADLLKRMVHDAQKEVDAKELDMKALDDREADIKHKIENIANPKEYSALKKELDKIHAEQHESEDALVNVWNKLENAQRTMTQKNDEIAKKIEDAQEAFRKKTVEIEQLEKQLYEAQLERPEKLKTIPAEWLEKYEQMYNRVDDPVVEVVQGGCGGCFYAIPNQDLLRLKRRALLQCNSCYRFLYDPIVLQAEPKEES